MLACMATYSLDDVRGVCKRRDAWWTVLLVDPVAVRLTRLLANRTSITPDQVTLASGALGVVAAGCFAAASPYWLALGALTYHAGFILDCCDGKLARLKGTGTPFGPWLEYVIGRVRMLCCAAALIGGQYARTGRVELLYVGFLVLFLDMFHHLNAVHSARTRHAIRARLTTATGFPVLPEPTRYAEWPEPAGRYLPSQDERLRYVEDLLHTGPLSGPSVRSPRDPFSAPSAGACAGPFAGPVAGREDRLPGPRCEGRPSWYDQARAVGGRCERTQVVSGVEFQMALFVIAPSIGAIAATAMVVGGLLMAFEGVAVHRLWLSTRECEDLIEELTEVTEPGPDVPGRHVAGERPLSDAGVR
jgi:phosphatidylglycerophosphate synthase